jgi:hypothetical protein
MTHYVPPFFFGGDLDIRTEPEQRDASLYALFQGETDHTIFPLTDRKESDVRRNPYLQMTFADSIEFHTAALQ